MLETHLKNIVSKRETISQKGSAWKSLDVNKATRCRQLFIVPKPKLRVFLVGGSRTKPQKTRWQQCYSFPPFPTFSGEKTIDKKTVHSGTPKSSHLPCPWQRAPGRGHSQTLWFPKGPWDWYIHLYVWLILMVNVSKYTIHGFYVFFNCGQLPKNCDHPCVQRSRNVFLTSPHTHTQHIIIT